MKAIHRELLTFRNIPYFIFLSLVIVGIGYSINTVFFTDAIVYNTYAERLTYERITKILESQRKYHGLSYLLIPVFVFFKVLYNSFCITTGSLLNDTRGSFKNNFNICLKVEYVFVLMLLTKFIGLLVLNNIATLNDLNFTPASIASFFSYKQIPAWLMYPLQTLNIWEVIYCFLGSFMYAIQYEIDFRKAIPLFTIPYLLGLMLWLLIVIFLTIQIS